MVQQARTLATKPVTCVCSQGPRWWKGRMEDFKVSSALHRHTTQAPLPP